MPVLVEALAADFKEKADANAKCIASVSDDGTITLAGNPSLSVSDDVTLDPAAPLPASVKVSPLPSGDIVGAPECPTAQHVMVISKGTYNSFICNRCGAGKSGERWFCGNCRDDFCLECEPRRDKPPSSGEAEETELKKLEALEAQISRDFDALSTDLATLEKMSWY
jgi:hypothetical protein